jgi:triosephosphate isomerase
VKTELLEALVKVNKKNLSNLIIAYEPVWAIGKKESEAIVPEDLHEMTIFIKKVLNDKFKEEGLIVPILYGGSVSKNNARDFITKGQIDGLLLGRESLRPENFAEVAMMLGEI